MNRPSNLSPDFTWIVATNVLKNHGGITDRESKLILSGMRLKLNMYVCIYIMSRYTHHIYNILKAVLWEMLKNTVFTVS